MSTTRTCPYCNEQDFRAPSDVLLFQHIRLVHAEDPGFSIQCSFDGCSRTFTHFRTYQNHILSHNSIQLREEDQSEPTYDCDSNGPLNKPPYIPTTEETQSFAAKWILKTSETRSLTRAASVGTLVI